MSEPLLSVQGLTRDFGGVRAVDLSLEVARGELRCLIGPNGAGKSTFFRILAGVLRPSAGSVRLGGVELGPLDSFQVARLGVAIKFQVPSLFEALTPLQNLHLAAERRFGNRDGLRRAQRMLDRIEWQAPDGEPVASLSHGQKQRLEIAMASVSEPSLVLLDEPTAGMSPQEVERTVSLVTALNEGATVIVVEHNMDFVRRLAGQVTVMHEGRVFAQGSMAEIEANPGVRDIYLGRKRMQGDAGGR